MRFYESKSTVYLNQPLYNFRVARRGLMLTDWCPVTLLLRVQSFSGQRHHILADYALGHPAKVGFRNLGLGFRFCSGLGLALRLGLVLYLGLGLVLG